jgi:hypothetical protein
MSASSADRGCLFSQSTLACAAATQITQPVVIAGYLGAMLCVMCKTCATPTGFLRRQPQQRRPCTLATSPPAPRKSGTATARVVGSGRIIILLRIQQQKHTVYPNI